MFQASRLRVTNGSASNFVMLEMNLRRFWTGKLEINWGLELIGLWGLLLGSGLAASISRLNKAMNAGLGSSWVQRVGLEPWLWSLVTNVHSIRLIQKP